MTAENLKQITEKYIKKVKDTASDTSIESLRSILDVMENNQDEYYWKDVRILHEIFEKEYQRKLKNK